MTSVVKNNIIGAAAGWKSDGSVFSVCWGVLAAIRGALVADCIYSAIFLNLYNIYSGLKKYVVLFNTTYSYIYRFHMILLVF